MIGEQDVLVAVNEAGEVIINFLNATKDPILLDNNISTWVGSFTFSKYRE